MVGWTLLSCLIVSQEVCKHQSTTIHNLQHAVLRHAPPIDRLTEPRTQTRVGLRLRNTDDYDFTIFLNELTMSWSVIRLLDALIHNQLIGYSVIVSFYFQLLWGIRPGLGGKFNTGIEALKWHQHHVEGQGKTKVKVDHSKHPRLGELPIGNQSYRLGNRM